MNGLSHVRKFIRLLSPELQVQLSEEIENLQRVTEQKLQTLESGSKVHELMKERSDYLKVMNELVGKIQFESMK